MPAYQVTKAPIRFANENSPGTIDEILLAAFFSSCLSGNLLVSGSLKPSIFATINWEEFLPTQAHIGDYILAHIGDVALI